MNASAALEPLERFRSVVADRFGLAFEPTRLAGFLELLERRARTNRLDIERYVERLELSPSPDELAQLAAEITVSETYFFRHSQQFDALQALLASSPARAGALGPKLLCAGCATGEEAFSLAIMLRERLPLTTPSILAVDLNADALARARQGRFSAWALRETPGATRVRWFREEGRFFHLDPSICQSVQFRQVNLATPDPLAFAPETYDVIFCRNVLMYFTREQSCAAVQRLHAALVPGGYLFLGSAETLRGLSQDFELCQQHGAFYYRKMPASAPRAETRARAAGPALRSMDAGALPDSPVARLDQAADAAPESEADWASAIDRAAARVLALTGKDSPPSRSRTGISQMAAERCSTSAGVAGAAAPFGLRADLKETLELLRSERFDDALSLVRKLSADSVDGDVLLLEAVLLSSGGRLDDARSVCHRLLRRDELNAGAHYLLGLCDAETGAVEDALRHHRIATYLDPNFAMPRLQLGLLLRRTSERAQARSELMHAASLLEHEDPARLTLFGGGFGRSALLELCAAELAAVEEDV